VTFSAQYPLRPPLRRVISHLRPEDVTRQFTLPNINFLSSPTLSSDSMTSSKSAIVVGGSLGGLFTGIVLKRLGYHVTIFERSPTPLLQDQGAGIVAGGDTLRFLRQFDKTKRDVAVVSPLRHYLDKHGDEEWTQKMTRYDSM